MHDLKIRVMRLSKPDRCKMRQANIFFAIWLSVAQFQQLISYSLSLPTLNISEHTFSFFAESFPFQMFRKEIAGDVVLVTGGGSGIGRLMCIRLAARVLFLSSHQPTYMCLCKNCAWMANLQVYVRIRRFSLNHCIKRGAGGKFCERQILKGSNLRLIFLPLSVCRRLSPFSLSLSLSLSVANGTKSKSLPHWDERFLINYSARRCVWVLMCISRPDRCQVTSYLHILLLLRIKSNNNWRLLSWQNDALNSEIW